MSDAVSRGQALQIAARVATQVKWDDINGDRLQKGVISLSPEEFGERFTSFLKNDAKLILPGPRIIQVDRARFFDPSAFIGKDHTIWKGLAGGTGLEGELDQDAKSLALTEIDLNAVRFDTGFEGEEKIVNGEVRLLRLKAKPVIRLDATVFQHLWENQQLIPEHWKEKTNGNVTCIFFDGTILRVPDGGRCVLYLCWGGEAWRWHAFWLDYDFLASFPSAVLAS